jgi:MiaB/RimO family radical SAM methylthiotransferase
MTIMMNRILTQRYHTLKFRSIRSYYFSSSASSKVEINRHQSSSEEKSQLLPDDGLTLGDFVHSKTSTSLENNELRTPNNLSFHIKTYGCQMNVNDTDIVRAVLLQHGFSETHEESNANIWLTNTCAIREKAEQKVWQRLRHQKKHKSPKQVVGLLGCMAERLQGELLKENMADLVVGPDAYRDLPHLLTDITKSEDPLEQAINVQLSLEETYEDIVPVRDSKSSDSNSAFVSIQRGCSNRCSFCIVPFTRGTERSRPFESILFEVQELVAEENLKEVVLLGQNVNSYHDRSEAALVARPFADEPNLSNAGFRNRIRRFGGGHTFLDLVEAISDISPELRVRFTSPHPKDYPSELLHLMAERPNVCNQLHMPAQSGSTTMLKRMKRGYSREAYLELIDSVQSIIPDVALSSDFIAGFCDETEEEHADTVSLLERVEYEQAFLFAYSMRSKTHAHRTMQDNVAADVKQRRLQELIDVFRTRVHAKNERVELGKLRLVLIEGQAKRQALPGMTTWHGRTDQNKRIMFPVGHDDDGSVVIETPDEAYFKSLVSSSFDLKDSSSLPPVTQSNLLKGDYAVVEVTEAKGHTLRGRLLCKSTLAGFAATDLSKLGEDRLKEINELLYNSNGLARKEREEVVVAAGAI